MKRRSFFKFSLATAFTSILKPQYIFGMQALKNPGRNSNPVVISTWSHGIEANEAIYVGDGKRDIISANAAGMYSVLACYGYLKTTDQIEDWQANMIIHQPSDLITLIA